MPALRLQYFDFAGGRGEAARLALAIGGVPFEDERIPLADWPSVRERMPLRAVRSSCAAGSRRARITL